MGDRTHALPAADHAPATHVAPPAAEHTNSVKPEQVDRIIANRGDTADTSWSINFGTIGREVGRPVTPRTPDTSLYLHDLKIAPDGEPGKAGPAPHHFSGVTLAPTGAAHIGTYTHPRNRAGIASAAISFGGKPSFDFTITSKPKDVKVAKADHTAVVRELARRLDEFVDDAEAQAVLDGVLAMYFGTEDVKAVIRRKDHQLGKPVNTSDLKYSAVKGDRNMRLRVDVPTVVKDKSMSWATTENGETTSAKEDTHGRTSTLETTSTVSVEQQNRKAFETALKSGLRGITKNFINNGMANELTTFNESGSGSETGGGSKLSSSVGGEFDIVPDLPVIGRLVKWLVGPKLKMNIAPDFSSTWEISGTKKDSSSTKSSFQQQVGTELIHEGGIENLATTLEEGYLKTKIETAIKVVVGVNDGEKVSGGKKHATSTSSSSTVGSVQVLSTAIQANLVEE
jgi:hypothetical protein